MPELPEVETMCRGIVPIVGRVITAVERPLCECRPCLVEPTITQLHRRLAGQRVTGISRRGKRVLIAISGGDQLVIEPRMTGLVLLADPPDPDHLRLRVRLGGESSGPDELIVWDRRGLCTIRLLDRNEFAQRVEGRLGPDALAVTWDTMRQRLHRSRRMIKVALLDQAGVAGIGNLYAAEILFVAGIDPRTRCDRMTVPQWQRLHAATWAVLHEAILHEGSTLSDGTYRNALNDPGSYQNLHRVYDRAGKPCRRCGDGVVRRIVQTQRSTFFCPVCQRKSGRHGSVVG